MINLINRLLVKLGLREQSKTWTTDWMWFGGYGPIKKDVKWLVFDTATAEGSTTETYDCDHSTSVKYE